MKPLRIFIVEDDILAAEKLEFRLKDLGYQIAGWTRSGEEALERIAKDKPDLALLDIDLKSGGGDMDGVELGMNLRQSYTFPIIYLTSFLTDKTRKRTKIVRPDGYLTKPVSEGTLSFYLEKAFEQASERMIRPSPLPIPDLPQPREEGTLYLLEDLFVKVDGAYHKIPTDTIRYVEAYNNYITIYTSALPSGKYVHSAHLGSFTRQFEHPSLLRVSRSDIINVQYIESFPGSHTIKLKGVEKLIPIGPTYRESVLKRFRFLKTKI